MATRLRVRVIAKAGKLFFLFKLYIFKSLVSACLNFLHIHDSNLEFLFSNDIIHFIKTFMCGTLTLYTIFSLNLLPFVWLQFCALFPICSFLMYLFVIPAPLNTLSTFYCWFVPCSISFAYSFVSILFCCFILQFFSFWFLSQVLCLFIFSLSGSLANSTVSDCGFVSKPSLTCNPLYSKEGHFSLTNFLCPGGT